MDNNTGNGDKKDAKEKSSKDNRPDATDRGTDKSAAAADKNGKSKIDGNKTQSKS